MLQGVKELMVGAGELVAGLFVLVAVLGGTIWLASHCGQEMLDQRRAVMEDECEKSCRLAGHGECLEWARRTSRKPQRNRCANGQIVEGL